MPPPAPRAPCPLQFFGSETQHYLPPDEQVRHHETPALGESPRRPYSSSLPDSVKFAQMSASSEAIWRTSRIFWRNTTTTRNGMTHSTKAT